MAPGGTVLHRDCGSEIMVGRTTTRRPHTSAKVAAAAAAFVVSLGVASATMAQISPLAQKAPDAGEIVAQAQRQGHVRVIVRFASPVPPEAIKPDPASIANVKAQVAAAQDAIIATHFGSASDPRPGAGFARGITRFDLTPGFAVNVTLPELEALAADPRVTHLDYDRAVPPARPPSGR